ncbi:hypothetical protein IRJ41_006504 [Triplophysa rosa]|uniref:Uncharacterized protein n=1 Tax=Triplophysa rosa TaxID=992332 RepID=A0A9W7WDI6_TRIRA|nr:hypothetical protein IRJ41_006504 [Triplophysa rosa]
MTVWTKDRKPENLKSDQNKRLSSADSQHFHITTEHNITNNQSDITTQHNITNNQSDIMTDCNITNNQSDIMTDYNITNNQSDRTI